MSPATLERSPLNPVVQTAMHIQSTTSYEHVVLDEDGTPRLASSGMKLLELVLAQQSYGWSPFELHYQFPHLTLGEIHSALAYYWDHRDEFEDRIRTRGESIEEVKTRTPEPPILARLRARKVTS